MALQKICAHCGNSFWGRSNQKFCTALHRTQANNKIASENRMSMKNEEKGLRKNFKILNKTFKEYGEEPIPIRVMKLLDFEPTLFNSITKHGATDRYWIFNLSYEVNSNSKTIKIYKNE